MNEQIERRLESEAASDSRGFMGDSAPDGVVVVAPCSAIIWRLSDLGIEVPPGASLAEMLELANPHG